MKNILSFLMLFSVYVLAAIEINVGNKKISLPPLDGMLHASSVSQEVVNFLGQTQPSNLKTLDGYIERTDIVRLISGQDAVFDKYVIVVTPVASLSKDVTLKEFSQMKKYFRRKFDILLTKQKGIIKEFNQIKTKVEKVVPLGINYETDTFLSASMLASVRMSSNNGTAEVITQVATLNCVLIKNKLIFMYVYKKYKTENDLEWVKETGKKLVEEIIAINAVNVK